MKPVIMSVVTILAAVGPAATAAPASALGPAPTSGTGLPKGQCLRTDDIGNHIVLDKSTLLLGGRGKSVYRVTMKGACLGSAISSDPIGIVRQPVLADICKPRDLELRVRGSLCFVDSITQLSAEAVAALPRGMKP